MPCSFHECLGVCVHIILLIPTHVQKINFAAEETGVPETSFLSETPVPFGKVLEISNCQNR